MFRYKFTKKVTFVLIILLFVSLHTYSQDTKPAPETKPLICSDCYNLNAKALVLPKPDYPAAALAVGASGKVDVLIEIDTAGNVVFAKPNSGHPLLWSAAVKAAMNAKFEPVLIGGKPVGGSGLITFNLVQANGISDNGVAKSSDIAGTSVDVSKSGSRP